MNWIFDLLIYFSFIFIIFFKCVLKVSCEQSEILQRLNNMRGIFAIQIVIGHTIRYEETLLYPLGKFMMLSVAFFFFVSAWGMICSLKKKEGYLKFFLQGKVGNLAILIIAMFIFGIVGDIIVPLPLNYIVPEPVLITFWKTTNWYLWELLFFYILFYLCYRFMKRFQITIFVTVVLILASYIFLAGWTQGWYISAIAFPLGLIWGTYYPLLMKFMNSVKGYVLTMVLTVVGLSSQLFDADSLLGMVYLRNVMCIAGVLILIYMCQIIKVDNEICTFLGRYSTEIYIFQFIYLRIFNQINIYYVLRVLIVLGCTIITAVVMHPIIRGIKSRCLINRP